jgi:hypothetical protein
MVARRRQVVPNATIGNRFGRLRGRSEEAGLARRRFSCAPSYFEGHFAWRVCALKTPASSSVPVTIALAPSTNVSGIGPPSRVL